jgi:hypothetical protein
MYSCLEFFRVSDLRSVIIEAFIVIVDHEYRGSMLFEGLSLFSDTVFNKFTYFLV